MKVSELISENVGTAITNYQTWGGILYNVKTYGAKGDGVADDTAAIQRAINTANSNSGVVAIPEGTYLIKSMLNVGANVKAFRGFGDVLLNFQNTNLNEIGIYLNQVNNFKYEGIRHTQNTAITLPIMWLNTCTHTHIHDNTFETAGSYAIGIALSTDIRIDHNYITDVGKRSVLDPSKPSHPAIWVGERPTYTNTDIHISKNRFYNCNYSALYYFAVSGTVTDNDVLGCRESTIFADTATHFRIIGNRIVCGTAVDSACFGIEAGGCSDFVISGNDISNAGEAGICISNAIRFEISNNLCINNGVGTGAAEQRAGIHIREYQAGPQTSRFGTIIGNICMDTRAVGLKTQNYGLGTYRDPAAGQIQGIMIEGNIFSGNASSSVNVWDEVVFLYDTVRFRNNFGYAEKPKTLSFTTTTSTGYQSFLGFGFRASFIEIYAFIDGTDQWCKLTVDTLGAGVVLGENHYGTVTHTATTLQLTNNVGAVQTDGAWDSGSLLNDGFKINFTSAAAALKVVATCYP